MPKDALIRLETSWNVLETFLKSGSSYIAFCPTAAMSYALFVHYCQRVRLTELRSQIAVTLKTLQNLLTRLCNLLKLSCWEPLKSPETHWNLLKRVVTQLNLSWNPSELYLKVCGALSLGTHLKPLAMPWNALQRIETFWRVSERSRQLPWWSAKCMWSKKSIRTINKHDELTRALQKRR